MEMEMKIVFSSKYCLVLSCCLVLWGIYDLQYNAKCRKQPQRLILKTPSGSIWVFSEMFGENESFIHDNKLHDYDPGK